MQRSFFRSMLALAGAALIVVPALAQDVKREITQIGGDLYRFKNNFHYSVFLVTDDGVIATDPINADAATWLKAEIAKRFDKPVRYVVYSHDHADHSSGGEVFANTATFIAHQNARRVMLGEKRPTQPPDITFSDRMNLELGGKTVELIYVGRNSSDNSIVMHFPEQRALFAVDFIPVKTVMFRDLADSYIPDWIDSIAAVEAMDFDILIPGHGQLGGKADVTRIRNYMQDLHGQVLEQLRAGKTLEETQAVVTMKDYSDLAQLGRWGPLNVKGMYERLLLQRRGN